MSRTTGRTNPLRTNRNAIKIINQADVRGVVLLVVAYRVRGVSETSSSPNVLHL